MESNLKIQQGANDGWFIYKDNRLLLGSHDKDLIEKIKLLLDETETETVVLRVLNANSFPSVVTSYKNGKIDTIQDGFIRDSEGEFKKIAKEIAEKLTNVDER